MPQGAFFERRTISPASLGIVVLLHAGAIAALALSKMEVPAMKVFRPLKIETVLPEPEPLPDKVPPRPEDPRPVPPNSQKDVIPPIVPALPKGPAVLHDPDSAQVIFDRRPPLATKEPPSEPLPEQTVPPPVRVEAKMRSDDLQPPYPPSEEKMEREGRVSVRITIGVDGRVTSVAKVSATSDAFYRATERHALRAWRFSPATLDGRPVESSKILTIHFRLDD